MRTYNINGQLISWKTPIVMGILNITTDSFYSASRYNTEKQIIDRVQQIIEEGGQIIDIGAYSSRPGATEVSEKEESERLSFALEVIKRNFSNLIISIDTFRSQIAYRFVNEFGVAMINDISAGELDKNMFATISKLGVPYIMMHMRGTPKTMQDNCFYEDIIQELLIFFSAKLQTLKLLGVKDVIIDPGFGFAKTLSQNYFLLSHLDKFNILDRDLLVGLSRKSMLYKLLEITADESLNATTAVHTIALLKGAKILRVHDVKAANQTIKITSMINKEQ